MSEPVNPNQPPTDPNAPYLQNDGQQGYPQYQQPTAQPDYLQKPQDQPQGYGQPTQGYGQPPAQGYQPYPQPGFQPYPSQGYGLPPEYGMPQMGPVEPPKPVKLAVNLMYVGALLSLLNLIMAFFMKDKMREIASESAGNLDPSQIDAAVNLGLGIATFSGLIGAGLWVLNALMNRKGKSWARIMSTVLGVIGVLAYLVAIFSPSQPPAQRGLAILMLLLPITILFLLWRPENQRFYEANSRPRV